MWILGLDPDTVRVAYALVEYDGMTPKVHSCGTVLPTTERMSAPLREAQMRDAVVYCEEIFLRNTQGFKSLAKVQGRIEDACNECRLELRYVYPSTWHSSFGWNGLKRAELKAISMQYARANCASVSTDHEADAICIAIHGALQFREKLLSERAHKA